MNDRDDEQAIPPPDPSWLRPWEREGEHPTSTTTFVAPRRKRRSPLSRLGDVLAARSSAPAVTEPPSARRAPPTGPEPAGPDTDRADLVEQREDRGPDVADLDQWHKWFDDLDPTPTSPTDAEPTPEPSDEPQSEAPNSSAEAPPAPVEPDAFTPADDPHELHDVAVPPEDDGPLLDEPTDAPEAADEEPATDETDAPAEAVTETDQAEADEASPEPGTPPDAPEVDEPLDQAEPSAPAEAVAEADEPDEIETDKFRLDLPAPPDAATVDDSHQATEAGDPAEAPAAPTELGDLQPPQDALEPPHDDTPLDSEVEADEASPEPIAPPDTPAVVEHVDETESSAAAEAPPTPVEAGPTEPAHGLAKAASDAPAPAQASAPAATTVAEPELDEPDPQEVEFGPWLRDVDEAARDLDETDRRHRRVLAGALLSLLVVAVAFGGVRIAQDRAADAAREQAARQAQTTSLAIDVLGLADVVGPAAAGAEPLAASLLVTLEEHLLASERSDAELDEARSDAVDELQRLADELREALAGPAPVPGTLVLDDAADPVLLAHARVRAEATALASEADAAADRAETWGAAVRSVTTALATHARIASEQPETSDPDELAEAWSAELGPLRVLADVAGDAAAVPGLQDWAEAHAAFAADSLAWVERAVTLLEDGDVETYNTELDDTLGVDDPFGFSATLADATRTALESPVLDAVATVEARAALVVDQVDALERTTGDRLAATPTP